MTETVFISGAAKGIGRAIALAAAKEGWNVVIHYDKSKEKAEELLSQIKKISNGIAVQADLNSKTETERAVREARNYFGKITKLVNNAGICQSKLFSSITESDFDSVMNTNFKSAFFLTQSVLPDMMNAGRGTVVNISSIWGVRGASYECVYSASKAALKAWSEALALEYAPSSIRFNCVAPGCVDTDMTKCYSEEEKASLISETPLMRFATPEDIASAVVFLLSDKSSFITGQTLTVDGGFLME